MGEDYGRYPGAYAFQIRGHYSGLLVSKQQPETKSSTPVEIPHALYPQLYFQNQLMA
jgi:hypothetical protein